MKVLRSVLPAPTAPALVRADEVDQFLGAARSWEYDRMQAAERWAKRGWWAFGAMCVVAVLEAGALIAAETRPLAAPPVLALDRTTGNVEVVHASNDVLKPYSELLEKFWVKRYVTARETYQYTTLQYDYDTVLALSADDVGRPYARLFEGDNARDKRWGAGTEERVRVISVVLPPDQQGKAVVRYEKTTKRPNVDVADPPQTYVATLAFAFNATSRGQEKDLIENPLGFKVTAYRTDPELTAAQPK